MERKQKEKDSPRPPCANKLSPTNTAKQRKKLESLSTKILDRASPGLNPKASSEEIPVIRDL